MKTVKSFTTLMLIFCVAIVAAVIVINLPHQTYLRYQLLKATIFENVRWDYERVHYDARPVDVAIVGASRSVLGLSADRIERMLSEVGKPSTVANFSIVEAGRNVESILVNELYETKKPKVLVVEINETAHPWGHRAFKYIAPASDILFPPAPFLHNYFYDISYLPYRQLELFIVSLFPEAFGFRTNFDPELYAHTRIDFTSFHDQADAGNDMDREVPASKLIADRNLYKEEAHQSIVPQALFYIDQADDHVYINQIVQKAKAHGTKVLFVYIPIYAGVLSTESKAYYERLGEVQDNGDLGQNNKLFQSWAHVNHAGAIILSDRVANAVAALL